MVEEVKPGISSDGVVILTPYEPSDASALYDQDHDPEHRRRFEFPDDFVPSVQHSLEVLARWERERLAGALFPFAVRDVATNTLVGGCELRPREREVANLSYWTRPAHRGRGVASRAVALACKLAFEGLALKRVEVLVDPDNTRSHRIAARNGFRDAGVRGGRTLYVVDAKGSGSDS
jgi:RimJ/RimL family protein N-acetyltransferase